MPVSDLIIVQSGKETTWGTRVNATSKWTGLRRYPALTIADTTEAYPVGGDLSPAVGAAQQEQHGMCKIDVDVLSYEDLLYLGHLGFGIVTPAAGPPKVWTFAAPTTAAVANPWFATFEFGAPNASYAMAGGIAQGLQISGEAGQFWKASYDLLGKVVTAQALTSLSDRVVTPIQMQHTTLALDAWGGTMGATAAAATLIKFVLDLKTNSHLKPFAGSLNPLDWGQAAWDGTLTLTVEFNATAKAVVDALITPGLVQRQIDIKAVNTANYGAELQFAGTLNDQPKLFGNRNGNIIVDMQFTGTKHATLTTWMKMICTTNTVGTLP